MKVKNQIKKICKCFDITTIKFILVGNGFRRYMVRHIVGGLIQVGAKRVTKERLQELLDSKGEQKCLFKAKPQGLYLHEVFYDEN